MSARQRGGRRQPCDTPPTRPRECSAPSGPGAPAAHPRQGPRAPSFPPTPPPSPATSSARPARDRHHFLRVRGHHCRPGAQIQWRLRQAGRRAHSWAHKCQRRQKYHSEGTLDPLLPGRSPVCAGWHAYVSIGDVQQVPQPAAPVVPALVADAVFQDHVVSAKGPQQGMHFLWGPLCIYLINLQKEIKNE